MKKGTVNKTAFSRRSFLQSAAIGVISPSVVTAAMANASMVTAPAEILVKGILVTSISVFTVKVNERGDWHFIELHTNKGLMGVGECSHAFPKAFKDGETSIRTAAKDLFECIRNNSPFAIETYRQRGFSLADTKLKRTVFSGIEQALWDLCGKVLGTPAYNFFGGKLRDKVRVYANINRATNERDANGKRLLSSFQRNAERAMKQGFTAVKLAPFDEMKALSQATPAQTDEDIRYAVDCVAGVRATIGKEIDLLIDVHSHLNATLAVQTAKQLEKSNLFWFEEPVDPERYTNETQQIRQSISQTLAGGESVFGRKGYEDIIHNEALGIIMPDVKHCGGLLECKYIAAMAEAKGNIKVAPHNPSGPVATAASLSVCATLPNFSILEYAFGEVPWSSNLVTPAEQFSNGYLQVPESAGIGISLNHSEMNKHK